MVRWIDRLGAGAEATEAEAARAPWRYLADLGAGVRDLSLGVRRLEADPTALSLLLDGDLRAHWSQNGIRRELHIRQDVSTAFKPVLPPAVELRRMHMCDASTDSGEELLFPLEAPPDEETDYSELIELIETNAMPIAGICNRPRVNLRVEERAEVLRRARRMTLRTAPYLARHPEDWEGQSLRMPYPRRLLTALPEDEWSTYENRMVRTVVRDAYGELVRREREVRAALRQLREALRVTESWQERLRHGDWPRANRIYYLLRGNVSVDSLKQRIDELEHQTQRLQRAVGVLGAARHSPLFRMLGAVRDERELRPTNLLLHDTSYRAASMVRQRLNRLAESLPERSVEDPLPAYVRWLHRALRHALSQVGLRPDGAGGWRGNGWQVRVVDAPRARALEIVFLREGASPKPDGPRVVTQDRLTGRQRRRASPTLEAERDAAPSCLVVVPIWLDLSEAKLRAQLLGEVAASSEGRRYLLAFPGAADDGSCSLKRSEANFPHLVEPVSPVRLDSVEVLARELVRETWLRDLVARRWPSWCAACGNPHVAREGRNKFECGTCGTEAANTQETCGSCGREFTTPYILRDSEARLSSAVSQADVLDVDATQLCLECQ
jgi:hypothetical protein